MNHLELSCVLSRFGDCSSIITFSLSSSFSTDFFWLSNNLSATLARYMPKTMQPNHTTWICRVKTENCMMAGPGHRPPIPQPKPKQNAPMQSFESIFLLSGLNSLPPSKGFFLHQDNIYLTLIIQLKVIRLTPTPHPSTNRSEGFQPSWICRKEIMLTRLTMPDTKSPQPKIAPTMKVISWSIAIYLPVDLFPSDLDLTMPPKKGKRRPRARKTLAEIV